jgi:hypothetical protein
VKNACPAFLTLLLAATPWLGCGAAKPTPPAAPGAAVEACALLNPDDVRTYSGDVMGTLSSTIDDTVGRDPSQCTYSLAGEVPPRVIGLQVRQAPSTEEAARLHRAAQSGLDALGGGTVAIPGLGDQAFWVGGKLDQMHVLAGNRQLIFTVQIDHDAEKAAQTLAARALARMNQPSSTSTRSR